MSEASASPVTDQPIVAPVAPEAPVIVAEAAAPAPVVEAPVAAAAAAKRRGRKPKAAPVAEPVVAAAPAVKAAAPKAKAPKTKVVVKPAATAPKPVKAATGKPTLKTKTSPLPTPQAAAKQAPLPKPKDKSMANTPIDFTAAFKTAFADFQEKAKAAYEKSTAAFGEANEFAKGNVEALVESGKILASGLQELGSSLTTESRTAFETLTAEAKELAAVKSPTEFIQLQSSLLRKHFDAVVAQTSKNTEAVLKLANETVAPISNRVTLAVEKVAKAA